MLNSFQGLCAGFRLSSWARNRSGKQLTPKNSNRKLKIDEILKIKKLSRRFNPGPNAGVGQGRSTPTGSLKALVNPTGLTGRRTKGVDGALGSLEIGGNMVEASSRFGFRSIYHTRGFRQG